ncbi:MAG: hypothetical protein JSR42_08605 [Proteobacteria bacterium]|nr:hypothetical protein [Pseudomonadota bacterium]
MNKAMDPSKGLFLCDGCVVREGVLLLATGFNADPDQDNSRVVYTLDGEWRHFDVEEDAVIATTVIGTVGYVVGARGSVFEIPLGEQSHLSNIDDAIRDWTIGAVDDLGELTRVRAIAGVPYCCGQSGQVYRLEGSRWAQVDHGLCSVVGPDLEDIAGLSPADIYAVGLEGALHHFDGRRWRQIELQTNVNISNIHARPDGSFVLCGDDGLIMCGSGDHWRSIGDLIPDKNYWGLESFGGALFLAHRLGIERLDDSILSPIEVKLPGRLTFHRLQSGAGLLFSIGTDDLLRFDGYHWLRIDVPARP